uniref:AlNc14C486G11903 protein n=1 Tax=Albugo laibachii Nc14 TaxID=890382 RepID=F0X0G0_9STRA|nr:AlNc14C486G11903 [Albugo laibachii Nc14]|eukprot:CCA27249.1 AlNc14C486G11903 [Albugo laibachii Nc14]
MNQLTVEINKNPGASQTRPEQLKPKPKTFCLLRFSTSDQCRSCFRQAADAEYFGEFGIFVHAIQTMTLHVFTTLKNVEDIFISCQASSACRGPALQIACEKFKQLMLEGPMRKTFYNEEIKLHKTRKSDRTEFSNVEEHIKTIKVTSTCVCKALQKCTICIKGENGVDKNNIIQNLKILSEDKVSVEKCSRLFSAEDVKDLNEKIIATS